MRKFKITKKAAAIGLAAGVVLGAGGAAFAYFTSIGNGTGSVSIGSATNFTVVQTGPSTGTLYPGTTTATVTFKITNPGKGYQNVGGVTASVVTTTGDITHTGAKVTGCLASWFSATAAFTPIKLAPGGHTTSVVTVTMHTANTTQNTCQGKSPEIHLHVTS